MRAEASASQSRKRDSLLTSPRWHAAPHRGPASMRQARSKANILARIKRRRASPAAGAVGAGVWMGVAAAGGAATGSGLARRLDQARNPAVTLQLLQCLRAQLERPRDLLQLRHAAPTVHVDEQHAHGHGEHGSRPGQQLAGGGGLGGYCGRRHDGSCCRTHHVQHVLGADDTAMKHRIGVKLLTPQTAKAAHAILLRSSALIGRHVNQPWKCRQPPPRRRQRSLHRPRPFQAGQWPRRPRRRRRQPRWRARARLCVRIRRTAGRGLHPLRDTQVKFVSGSRVHAGPSPRAVRHQRHESRTKRRTRHDQRG